MAKNQETKLISEYQETTSEALGRTRSKLLLVEQFLENGSWDDVLRAGEEDINNSHAGLTWILQEINSELYDIEKKLVDMGE